jgi:hypothetical protein
MGLRPWGGLRPKNETVNCGGIWAALRWMVPVKTAHIMRRHTSSLFMESGCQSNSQAVVLAAFCCD